MVGAKQKRQKQDEWSRAKLLAQVAEAHYVRGRPQKEIATSMNKQPTKITQLLAEARELGVVSFDIDSSFGITGREDRPRSREVRDRFQLVDANVIELDMPKEGATYEHDDLLHMALANQAGVRLRDQIAPEEHICVGGGRAVFQAVRAIRCRPPTRKNIHVTPLSGRFGAHYWEVRGPTVLRPLDADDAAVILASAFEREPGTALTLINYPLYSSSSPRASRIISDHCPFSKKMGWRRGVPDRAVVGFGAVDPKSGHRLADLFRENPNATSGRASDRFVEDLRHVARELKVAVGFVEKRELPYFGDIGNRLFPVLPLPEEIEGRDLGRCTADYLKLMKTLDSVNNRTVVVGWRQLQEAPRVLAIGGGPFKLRCLWTLLLATWLKPSNRVITELCTDSDTAQDLNRAQSRYGRLSDDEKSWYRTIMKKLFRS